MHCLQGGTTGERNSQTQLFAKFAHINCSGISEKSWNFSFILGTAAMLQDFALAPIRFSYFLLTDQAKCF